MEDGSQNIFGYLENIPGNLDNGYWEHILGYLDIWKIFLAGGKIILDVWMDMEISVTGSDAAKVPTLSFTSEDLIARLLRYRSI